MAATRPVLPSAARARAPAAAAARVCCARCGSSPIPATLQDARFRLARRQRRLRRAAGPAARAPGRSRPDRAAAAGGPREQPGRARAPSRPRRGAASPRHRCAGGFVDAVGQPRWFSLAVTNLGERGAPPLWLTLLQDEQRRGRRARAGAACAGRAGAVVRAQRQRHAGVRRQRSHRALQCRLRGAGRARARGAGRGAARTAVPAGLGGRRHVAGPRAGRAGRSRARRWWRWPTAAAAGCRRAWRAGRATTGDAA